MLECPIHTHPAEQNTRDNEGDRQTYAQPLRQYPDPQGPQRGPERLPRGGPQRGEAPGIENFIPIPDDVRNSSGNTMQLRDWVLHNWGTKWGAYEFDEVQETENTLAYVFITAWGPFNQHAMKVMSSRFPSLKLTLDYEEPGMGFKGQTVAEGGNIRSHWSRDMTPDEMELEE